MDWKNNFDKKEMIKSGIILIVVGLIIASGCLVIYLFG
jgi:hypothetical protein